MKTLTSPLKIALLCALTAASTSALAQYKCQVAGRTVFMDEPCRNTVRRSDSMPPASVAGQPQPTTTVAQSPAPSSDMARQKAYLATQENNRRKTAIKEEIAALEEQNAASQQRRDSELDYLQYRKAHAKNNLAGATLEHGLATEMQAVTQRHAADQATRDERLRNLRGELAALK